MIKDKTGRKLKVGQIVEMLLMGMYQGKVLDIKEAPLVLSPKEVLPPHIIVQCIITPNIMQDGSTVTYIVQEPDPKDPLVIESEGKKGPRLVHPS